MDRQVSRLQGRLTACTAGQLPAVFGPPPQHCSHSSSLCARLPCLDAHVLEAVQRLLAAHLLQQAHMLTQHVQLQQEGTKVTMRSSRSCLHTMQLQACAPVAAVPNRVKAHLLIVGSGRPLESGRVELAHGGLCLGSAAVQEAIGIDTVRPLGPLPTATGWQRLHANWPAGQCRAPWHT